jgi:hypothetical protein
MANGILVFIEHVEGKINRLPVKNKQTQFLEGSPGEVVARLRDKLKNEARVF